MSLYFLRETQKQLIKFNKISSVNVKNLWGYVAVAFNRVDADRLKLVSVTSRIEID